MSLDGLSLGRMTSASNKDCRVLVDDIRDGKIQEVWTYVEDQYAADDLWFSSNRRHRRGSSAHLSRGSACNQWPEALPV